jgi:mono/diheme cytochrome c family protein
MRLPLLTSLLLVVAVSADAASIWAQEPTDHQIAFFEKNVRPVLAEHCFACHGAEKQWSNLRLDSRERMLKGGDNGPAIVPGKPEESSLIKAVRQTDDELSMPPEDKLSDRQIADLEEWIRQGAPFPADLATAGTKYRDASHWSFQPPVKPPLPAVQNQAWVRTPIDAFILGRLEAEGISPAARADKRTLIRRATFDLTGLPPTPEEIAAFLADDSADSYARLIDRLLESPAYGERWGRHWLDVARYADSNGLDENICHGNAWRYRDYVVDSLNRDKPYRRFIEEQLAGDLLEAASDEVRRENLIATGFLSIGPKVLAEVDQVKMEMDILDEQLDTVGRAFMGLTLGCARCHDHKFDPVDTADYYGLLGVLKSTRTMESFKLIARWHENSLPDAEFAPVKAAHDAQVAEKKAAIQKVVDEATAAVKAAKPEEPLPEQVEPLFSEEVKQQLKQLRDELAALENAAPQGPSAMGVADQQVADVAIHIRGSHLKLGDVVPRRVPTVFTSLEAPQFAPDRSGRLELARWLTDPRHPLTYRVIVNRVWRWHFGRGLVPTTDNFGMLGETPTHPELLDYLALEFLERGTSLKELHRLIMLSSTYQQSSVPAASALALDPDNRLWSRFEVRRLEAEAVRDSLLAVSGALDRTPGGSLLTVKNREFFFDHTSKDLTKYDSLRRSLYLPIVRNNVYDVLQLLDYPDAAVTSGDRATTTIAPQALLMLNSDLVLQASESLAQRITAATNDDSKRIANLYLRAYGRDATEQEMAAAREFLTAAEREIEIRRPDVAGRMAWESLCQAILAANEFIYVE